MCVVHKPHTRMRRCLPCHSHERTGLIPVPKEDCDLGVNPGPNKGSRASGWNTVPKVRLCSASV